MSKLAISRLFGAGLVVQLLVFSAILLNIPLLRQVIVFVYLTFLPGFLILRFFKPAEFTIVETVLFSSGLSIVFLMFLGLFVNEVYPALGILQPLSPFPLLLSGCAIIMALYFVGRRCQNNYSLISAVRSLKFHPSFLLLISLPFIAVLGAVLGATFGNNFVLLILVVLISLVVLCIFSRKLIPKTYYSFAILSISSSLLLQASLVSPYIIGFDVNLEYFFANLSLSNSIWNIGIQNAYNGMLSVTVLPAIYSNFLNVDLTGIYKIVFPLIFSLVPLALFQAYRKFMGSRTAFLAVFLFMSIEEFYSTMLSLPRQMIGELFLALLILLIVAKNITLAKRKLLFVIFGAGLIVSTYSLAYIFLFFLLFTFCFFPLVRKKCFKERPFISWKLVVSYLAMLGLWDFLVYPEISRNLLNVLRIIYLETFVDSTTGPGIAGLSPSYLSPIHNISSYLFYVLLSLIIIGIVKALVRFKDTKYDSEYLTMSLACISTLVACLIVPVFAGSLQVSRWIQISFLFLSPFSILGGKAVLDLVSRASLHLFVSAKRIAAIIQRSWLPLMSVLLVCFFLFQVGFVYEITNDVPTSTSLGIGRKDRWQSYMISSFILEQDFFSARWLGSKIVHSSAKVYGDQSIYHVLLSYGSIPSSNLFLLSNSTENVSQEGYIYLSDYNVVRGLLDGANALSNTTQIKPTLDNMDKIYSSGTDEIYYSARLTWQR